MHISDLQLVKVLWGEDIGIISLSMPELLFYVYGKSITFSAPTDMPTAEITDAEMEAAGYEDGGNWDEVRDYLLKHPEKIIPADQGSKQQA